MCTATEHSDDDVWGLSGDEAAGTSGMNDDELQRERHARQSQFFNAGYRDGVDAGKERSLQQGFNTGFAEGGQAGYEWGFLKATVRTLELLLKSQPESSQLVQQVEVLRTRVSQLTHRQAMLGQLKQVLVQPPTVSLAAAGDSDLNAAAQKAVEAHDSCAGFSGMPPGLQVPDMAHEMQAVREALSGLGLGMPSQG
mmetsp:Transcript_16716/g.28686  ORF Transcript_16716/g.28686 Transcript_16716/m.28686 type:complete len:196 (-) Transcript_16716:416-1003(-)